jgi:hypothetical protein
VGLIQCHLYTDVRTRSDSDIIEELHRTSNVPSYLTESSNAPARNYALAAAQDGVITYEVSANTNPVVANWIDRIYEYTAKLLGISCSKVSSGAEFEISLTAPDYRELYDKDYTVNDSGKIRWSSVHNTKQYGGVDDQRTLVKAIGNSLGLSRLNWKWLEAGNRGEYTTKDTIMSDVAWDRGYDFGHTVFFTEDDKNSLKEIYGRSIIDGITGARVVHMQRIKEDLLIGANGQIDEFRLVAKGMNADNKDAISYDPKTGWDWVNDYNIPTIVNFNPYEGDRILISRRLYMYENPIHPDTPIPRTIRVGEKMQEVNALDYLNNIKIDFNLNDSGEEENAVSTTDKNTMFNDAGKLMLNVNGRLEGLGPPPVWGNGQLLAFVDIIGAGSLDFQAEWLGLWMEQGVTSDSAKSNNIVPSIAGKANLTGLPGGTTFAFELPSEFGPSKLDVITNFNRSAGDKIGMSANAFSEISEISFKSVKGVKQLKKASRAGFNVVYERDSGSLYYDSNGKSGQWGDGGEFARILDAPLITREDFVVI